MYEKSCSSFSLYNSPLIKELPSPSDFRVDQLLTSEFFGLNSTFDPEVERVFDQYYALLAMDKRSVEEEIVLGKLRATTRAIVGRCPFKSVTYSLRIRLPGVACKPDASNKQK